MASFQELFLQIVFISLLLIFSKFNKKFQWYYCKIMVPVV
jgi:hypothetical protein